MPNDLRDRIVFLNAGERARLAAWLRTWLRNSEPVTAINRGRWQQLKDGSTDYISQKEIKYLNDFATPRGCALDIIRGGDRAGVN